MRRGLDGFLLLLACVQFSSLAGASVPRDFGGHSEGETPLPIPNRAVKPLRADGTWWATAWESRSPPVLPRAALHGRLFFVHRQELRRARWRATKHSIRARPPGSTDITWRTPYRASASSRAGRASARNARR